MHGMSELFLLAHSPPFKEGRGREVKENCNQRLIKIELNER